MSETPIVRVEQGELQGRLVTSPSCRAFYSFQGIPYAKPPLGSLRFKAPQPAEPWEGVRDATSEGNSSAQIDPFLLNDFIGDENCLFLNVYTPGLDGQPLPVIVHIHGGGFHFGSGSTVIFGPDYLVEKDVVVVTINYRLGPLGFLCLNTPEVPGNAGLRDMALALRWIKQNIRNFGGDPDNLTISGESCGGSAVCYLTASPLTKNLISKAIIQSGTALHSWSIQNHPLENARALAKDLGCESEDIDEILEFLMTAPVKDIVKVDHQGGTEQFLLKGLNTFAPVIEMEFPGVEAALTEPFLDLLTSGRVAQVPVMIGSTSLELTYNRDSDDMQSFIPHVLNLEWNSPESLAVAEEIKRLYFKGSHTGEESLLERYQLLSDVLMTIDTHRYVQYFVKAMNKPIYYYKFDYYGELNLFYKVFSKLRLQHAGHMDDIGHLYTNVFQKSVEPTPQDIKMRERMVRLWTNFAKVGNPTPDENHYLTVRWLPATEDNLYYMRLASELSLETNPDKEKMEFWERAYSKYFKIWDNQQASAAPAPTKVEIVDYVKHELSPPVIIQETVETIVKVVETQESQAITELASVPEPIAPAPAPVYVPEPVFVPQKIEQPLETVTAAQNGLKDAHVNGSAEQKKPRTSNEIKMVQNSNGHPKEVIRANDPPEDDLPKNIGVNKFVNFFESLGGKK